MKVAMLTSLRRGGTVEVAVMLARGLTKLGIEVHSICADTETARRFAMWDVTTEVIPLRGAGDLTHALKLQLALRGFDVVHCHDRRTALWSRLLPTAGRRGLHVYTAHGIADPYLPPPVGDQHHRLRDVAAYEFLDPLLARRSDLIISVSHAVAADLIQRLRYPPDRMIVIPNGVDCDHVPYLNRELTGYVATLSMLRAVKGLDTFLHAIPHVSERFGSQAFALFGDGEELSALQRIALDLGLAGLVRFPGHTASLDALSQTRIFVLPSYWENAPMALLEAMSLGVPCVATNVWGIPEIATPDTAELVPAGDPQALAAAIMRLLHDPGRALLKARAARERVAHHFGYMLCAQRTAEAYERGLRKLRK